MKLEAIQIGMYRFEAEVTEVEGSVLTVAVTCDGVTLARKMNHQGTHDHTEEQFDKDVRIFVEFLANELAGTLRSRELAQRFRKGKE